MIRANSIIGFSDLLLSGMSGKMSAEQDDYLKDIKESGSHLLSLINDILDISKVEAGKMTIEPSEFDLGVLIEGSLSMFKEKAVKRNIKAS